MPSRLLRARLSCRISLNTEASRTFLYQLFNGTIYPLTTIQKQVVRCLASFIVPPVITHTPFTLLKDGSHSSPR